jgi:hypothetical protein
MEGISDIKIVGIDAKRPPVIRKEPYINMYFKLSHKVPLDWGQDFNALMAKIQCAGKINTTDGLYIETWVRTPDEITEHLQLLKDKIAECNKLYIAKILMSQSKQDGKNAALGQESGEQGRLNTIIAGLKFDG